MPQIPIIIQTLYQYQTVKVVRLKNWIWRPDLGLYGNIWIFDEQEFWQWRMKNITRNSGD